MRTPNLNNPSSNHSSSRNPGENEMSDQPNLAGTFTFPGTQLTVNRVGYGAMQLAGREGNKFVWGPPEDPAAAIAVLQAAIAAGVNHIDTSDIYGPHTTNQLIRKALAPYPYNLVIVTKVGTKRTPAGGWISAHSKTELTSAVHDNIHNLEIDTLDIVNFRATFSREKPVEGSIEAPITVLAELQQQGFIRHIGVSNVTPTQIAEARSITPIVCVQNHYNFAHRADDALIDQLNRDHIAYVPYFPLGGFSPVQSDALTKVAAHLSATTMQVALAWLLQRSPNILVIPGTSSVAHLNENLQSATLKIPADQLALLNKVGTTTTTTANAH
jgi:pyridoxine 4-dehydrogenase